MTDMLDMLDEPTPEAWIAEEGDKLAGTVVSLSSRDGGYGEYPIVTVDVLEGSTVGGKPIKVPATLSVHGYGTVLTGELWRESVAGSWKIAEGDQIAFKYDGKREGRNGNAYDSWVVKIKRATLLDSLDQADPQQPTLFS